MKKGKLYFYTRSICQIFFTQYVIMFLLACSALYTNIFSADDNLNFMDYIGLITWLIGFFWEVVGDYQLSQWIKTNRGKIINVGLWKYTRHPNYFGEVVMWWGIYFIACGVKWGWITIWSPLIIWAVIYFLTGPLLEVKYRNREDWREYKKRTNYFFPWFPKKKEKVEDVELENEDNA